MTALPVTTPRTAQAMFAALEAKRKKYRSNRLGAGSIGDSCERKLWDAFRWAFPAEDIDGQKASIFVTGDLWETRIVQMMRDAGIVVHDRDEATGKQFSRTFCGGHGVCKADGVAENVPEAPKTPHLLEIKSHKDSSFVDLIKNGVRGSKPTHYAQVQAGMEMMGLTRAIYVAVNKNDDQLFVDRIEYDPVFCLQLMTRAERIVTGNRRPPCTCSPYLLKAGYGCAPSDGVFPARNCRTCLHSTAHLDGDARWSCARWAKDLTIDEQRAGCANHLFNPSLVPGEQVDADEANERVTYRLASGDVWIDGGRV